MFRVFFLYFQLLSLNYCNIALIPTFYQDPTFYINISPVKISLLVTFMTMMLMLRRKRKRRRDEDNVEEVVEGGGRWERRKTMCIFSIIFYARLNELTN